MSAKVRMPEYVVGLYDGTEMMRAAVIHVLREKAASDCPEVLDAIYEIGQAVRQLRPLPRRG